MKHLKISAIGNANTFSNDVCGSPLLKGLKYGASSMPSTVDIKAKTPGGETIERREVFLTVDTATFDAKRQIEDLLAKAGFTEIQSEFVDGEFPNGAWYDASDDDD